MPLLAANANMEMHRDKRGYLIFETATDFTNAISILFERLKQDIKMEKVLISNTIPYDGDPKDLRIHQKSYWRIFRGLPFIGSMRVHVARYTKSEEVHLHPMWRMLSCLNTGIRNMSCSRVSQSGLENYP